MANPNNIREGVPCDYPQNGHYFQQPINTIDSLHNSQNSQNSQNTVPYYSSNAQQLGQNDTNQQILPQQNNLAFGMPGIPIIPQNQNDYSSFHATNDNYVVTSDQQQFCCSQHNHHHPVNPPQITFTHRIPGYTVMLVLIPTNNLNIQNQQSQHHSYLNNYLNNYR